MDQYSLPENGLIFSLEKAGLVYGSLPALEAVNLEIRAGERVALVGPSGAGKSTLLRLLNGSLLPTSGTVRVLGQDLARLRGADLRKVQRRIGTVYQQFHLVNTLPVIHNVNAGHLGSWRLLKALFSLIQPQEVGTAARALAQVGIPEKLYETTGHLSGGQQQRVAIARVLVQEPQAILADEPIASLDPERSREIMDLLRDLSRRTQVTLVASLHAIEFARTHFDRVIGLRRGRFLFDTAPESIDAAMIERLYRIEE
jgi:phosphonate transport system ATP-binding protein